MKPRKVSRVKAMTPIDIVYRSNLLMMIEGMLATMTTPTATTTTATTPTATTATAAAAAAAAAADDNHNHNHKESDHDNDHEDVHHHHNIFSFTRSEEFMSWLGEKYSLCEQ